MFAGFYGIQNLVFLALNLFVFVLCVVALVDLLRRPAGAFPAAGKRTKTFWGAILGVATAVAFVALPPLNFGQLGILVLLGAVGAIVYLVDVRPALGPHRRGPQGPTRPSGW